MPSTRAPIAERRANVRAAPLTPALSHAPSAYAAYASTPTGRVIAVLSRTAGQMPGSGWTTPNPHSVPSPTQPDQIATAAGDALSHSGQRRGPLTPRSKGAAGSSGDALPRGPPP